MLIVGHSAGGARAYMFGKKMADEAKFHPAIITLDAATVWGDVYRCPVESCINIHTLTYPKIPGSYNLSAGKITNSIVTHVSIPLNGGYPQGDPAAGCGPDAWRREPQHAGVGLQPGAAECRALDRGNLAPYGRSAARDELAAAFAADSDVRHTDRVSPPSTRIFWPVM